MIVIDVLSSLAFNTEEEERDACGQLLKEKWRGGDIERDKKKSHKNGGEEKNRVGEGNRLVSPPCLMLD